MKQILRGILTLVVFSGAQAAEAAELPLEGLRRFETPHYTIVAASESEALRAATYAAQAEQTFCKKFERASRAPRVPTTLLLLTGKQVDRYLANAAANYRRPTSTPPSNYLLLPAGASAGQLRRATYHQVAHVFLQSQFDEPFPYWYEEGFALLAETLHVDGQQARVGAQRFNFRDRDSTELQEGNRVMTKEGSVQQDPKWISLSRIFSCDDTCGEYSDDELRYRMRREQWVVVHRALVGDVEFGRQVSNYLQLWRDGVSADHAIQQAFGASIGALDRNMLTYAGRENFSVARFRLDAPVAGLRESQAFRPGEVEGMLASLQSMHGVAP
jgi:hypothetical protein